MPASAHPPACIAGRRNVRGARSAPPSLRAPLPSVPDCASARYQYRRAGKCVECRVARQAQVGPRGPASAACGAAAREEKKDPNVKLHSIYPPRAKLKHNEEHRSQQGCPTESRSHGGSAFLHDRFGAYLARLLSFHLFFGWG